VLPSTDRQMVQRIDDLIKNIKATPFQGIGKPEPLKYDLSGWWSRRITKEHRLVYRVKGNPGPLEIALEIMQCRYHY
jgi:toxin YoeB